MQACSLIHECLLLAFFSVFPEIDVTTVSYCIWLVLLINKSDRKAHSLINQLIKMTSFDVISCMFQWICASSQPLRSTALSHTHTQDWQKDRQRHRPRILQHGALKQRNFLSWFERRKQYEVWFLICSCSLTWWYSLAYT